MVASQSVRRVALIDARDVGAMVFFAGLQFGLPVKEKRRLSRWLRTAAPGAEISLGEALVVRGTRVPIRGLAKQIEAGQSLDVLRREYDYVDEDAFEFAVQWAKSNPRRGRPSTGRGQTPEPVGRREAIERRRLGMSAGA